jgi:hypothetical protein
MAKLPILSFPRRFWAGIQFVTACNNGCPIRAFGHDKTFCNYLISIAYKNAGDTDHLKKQRVRQKNMSFSPIGCQFALSHLNCFPLMENVVGNSISRG